MAISIGEIEGTLRLRDAFSGTFASARAAAAQFTQQFVSTVEQAGHGAKEFGEKLGEFIENPVHNMGEAIKAAAHDMEPFAAGIIAIGGVAVVAGKALFELAENAAQVGGSIEEASLKMGESAVALSNLRGAAIIAGASLDQIGNAMFIFQRGMAEGTQKFSDGMQRIGLDVEDLKAANPSDQFLAISAGIKTIEDPAQRAAIAMELFGRQGRELLPLLMKPMDELIDESKALGSTWTDEDAKAAEEFEMHVRALGLQFDNLKIAIGRSLIGPLETLIGWLKTGSEATGEFLSAATGLGSYLSVFAEAWRTGAAAIDVWRGKVEELPPNIKKLTQTTEEAAKAQKELNDRMQDAAHTPEKDLQRYWKDGLQGLQLSMADVNKRVAEQIDITKDLDEKTKEHIKTVHEAEEAHKRFAESVKNLTSSSVGAVKGFGAFGVLMTDLSRTAGAFRETLYNLDASVNAFHDGISVAGDTVATVTIPTFTELTKGVLPQMTDALDKAREHVATFGESMGKELTSVLDALPNIFQRAFEGGGGIMGAIQSLSLKFGQQIGTKMTEGITSKLFGGGGQGEGESQSKASQYASAATQIGLSMIPDVDEAGGPTSALGGAVKGAKIGSIAGPYGAAIGAAIGAIVGAFKDREAKDEMRTIGESWGIEISGALAMQMEKDIQSGKFKTEMAAALGHLGDIIKEAGGLKPANLDMFTSKLHDVFSMIETHQMTIEQGTKVLDDNWAQFAEAGTDATGRISDGLKQIVQLNEQFGTQSKQIQQWLQGQSQNAAAGLNAVVAGLLPKDTLSVWDSLRAKVEETNVAWDKAKAAHDKAGMAAADKANIEAMEALKNAATAASGGLSDLGIQAVATYAAMVASGKSESDALAAIHPALQSLQHAYETLGLNVDDVALKSLMFRDKVVTAAPELVNAVGGLSQEMIALDNMGLMNVNTFSAMQRTGQTMFEKLRDKVLELGGTDEDALSQMQAFLHQAEIEAKKLGVPLDENTQKLIDQSKEAGIWQDAITPQDALIKGMQTLVDKVTDLVNALNHIPPKVSTTVTTTHEDVFVERHESGGGEGGRGEAGGGMGHVSGPTLFYSAGNEDYAFSGEGRSFERGLPGGGEAAGGGAHDDSAKALSEAVDRLQHEMSLLPASIKRAVRDAVVQHL